MCIFIRPNRRFAARADVKRKMWTTATGTYLLLSLGTPYRRIEARGDEDELRRELARHGHEDLEEGGQVVRVVVALRVERDVHVEAGPRAGPHVVEVRLPQLGPKRPELVSANEDNGIIFEPT